MPQKKFFGNRASEDVSNCLAGELEGAPEAAVRAAFDETLQAENRPAGSAAAMPAATVDCANSRRVRRKVECGSFKLSFKLNGEACRRKKRTRGSEPACARGRQS